jgi:very-short-patch-repair endonuclease
MKFCSVECKGKSYKKRFETSCLTCGLKFETTYGKNKKYCSKPCHNVSLSQGQSLKNMKATNLKKYGTECVSQVQEFKHKKHDSMKRNKTYGKSKVEDKIYELLISIYGENEVERQHSANGWAIDFFIKPTKIYLQVDGAYWHGLDRIPEIIKESKKLRDLYIFKNIEKDNKQNKWFLENNLKLVRITDQQIKSFKTPKEELVNLLGTKS